MRSKKNYRLTIFFSFAAALYACSDTFDSSYTSYSSAEKAGAFYRGWIPDWIPKNVTEIYETHNLDTNLFMVKFVFPKHTDFNLPSSCKSVVPTSPPRPPFNRKWWPSDVPTSGIKTHRHAFYLCIGENAAEEYVAISSQLGEGYVWQSTVAKRTGR